MPLKRGSSRKVVASNIREMEASGHPHNVAVAAALHTADKSGGSVAAKRDSTSAGVQNPLATGFNQAAQQGGGIVPNAQADVVKRAEAPIAGPKEIFDTIRGFLTGHKNSTNNRMSPSTTKDKGY